MSGVCLETSVTFLQPDFEPIAILNLLIIQMSQLAGRYTLLTAGKKVHYCRLLWLSVRTAAGRRERSAAEGPRLAAAAGESAGTRMADGDCEAPLDGANAADDGLSSGAGPGSPLGVTPGATDKADEGSGAGSGSGEGASLAVGDGVGASAVEPG